MEISKELLGQVAGVLALAAYVFYWWDIWAHRNNPDKGTKPNKASWFMLALVSSMIAYSYYEAGADDTFWVALAVAFGAAVTWLLSIPYGTGGWKNKIDRWCLLLAGLSILFWKFGGVEDPTVLLVNSLILDFIALTPTIRHAYEAPHEESLAAWGITEIADFLAIGAISVWTFDIAVYPIYMAVINGIVVVLILLPRFKRIFK